MPSKNHGRMAQDMKRELIRHHRRDEGPARDRRPADRHAAGCDPRPGPGQGLHQRDGTGRRSGTGGQGAEQGVRATCVPKSAAACTSAKRPRFVFWQMRAQPMLPISTSCWGNWPPRRNRPQKTARTATTNNRCRRAMPAIPEKRNCMTQSVDHETVVSRLLSADEILILCHKNPDGDTIGSGTALCLALQKLGKTAAVLCSDPVPAMYAFLPITVFDAASRPALWWRWTWPASSCSATANNMPQYANMWTCASTITAPTAAMPTSPWWTTARRATAELLTALIPEMGVEITPDSRGLPVHRHCHTQRSTVRRPPTARRRP